MAKLILEIPEEIVNAIRLPPGEIESEIWKELALALYRRGALAFGKARALAQMTRWEFEQLLADRQIPRHYGEADVEEDLRHAQVLHGSRPSQAGRSPDCCEESST